MFSSNDARRRALKRKCRDVRPDSMSRIGYRDRLRAKSALKLSQLLPYLSKRISNQFPEVSSIINAYRNEVEIVFTLSYISRSIIIYLSKSNLKMKFNIP